VSDRTPGGPRPADPGEAQDPRDPREDVRIDATVLGRVQGVGFRWFVLDMARELELRGWVSNEADGSVRCVAEGPPEALQALIGELGRGPLGARVERVIPRWGRAVGGLGPFEIRSGHHRGD
jgi:acylphosphatase